MEVKEDDKRIRECQVNEERQQAIKEWERNGTGQEYIEGMKRGRKEDRSESLTKNKRVKGK